jgi:hypothetical protein
MRCNLWKILLVLATTFPRIFAISVNEGVLACDREMRRTLEAIQSWRRSHNGAYPGRIADLKEAGLLPAEGAICPSVRAELSGANPRHGGVSSRRPGGDPPGTYEYEVSNAVLKSEGDRVYLLDGTPEYTRRDLKTLLLRRKFWEQVPVLRCGSHRSTAPLEFRVNGDAERNATATGLIYWSAFHWEQEWLDDVPYCEREANVLFGLKGPPFYEDRAPNTRHALDLRTWSCAFGDHPWWWTYPLFIPKPRFVVAADLRPFFQEKHGRVANIDGEDWWLNGLTQLQGRLKREGESYTNAPGMLAFAWQKTNAPVNRAFSTAAWLQGTIWTAPIEDRTGWLVWHYDNGQSERVPIVYGKTTGRFWAEPEQIKTEENFPKPIWKIYQSAKQAGKERWLRIYRQSWSNPRPEVAVKSVDFLSNSNSPASPFIIAINVYP